MKEALGADAVSTAPSPAPECASVIAGLFLIGAGRCSSTCIQHQRKENITVCAPAPGPSPSCCSVFCSLWPAPRRASARSTAAAPPETLLNPDGTLRLDGTFSGALDVSGWQVTLDPERGPLFAPQSSAPRWNNPGSAPNGALNGRVFALAVSGNDVYVGGAFTNAAGIAAADYVAR